MSRYVWIVIDDLPEEFGIPEICGVFDNAKAAKAEAEALRQIDNYKNQYVRIAKWTVRGRSIHQPVRARSAS